MSSRLELALVILLALAASAACDRSSGRSLEPAPDLTSSQRAKLATPRDDLPGLENFAEVDRGLYRGQQPDAEGFATLERLGVKTVVSLRTRHSDRELLKGTGLAYVELPVSPRDLEEEAVLAFLKVATTPDRQPVFVHCKHGADRTGAMVAVYRMVVQGWSREEALAELPRFGFHEVWRNLRTYVEGVDPARLKARLAQTKAPAAEVIP